MNKFREEPPIKEEVLTVVSKYQLHKPTLEKNFRNKCGYCNDNDVWRNTFYEVDHYIPKGYLTEDEIKEYWNLIYSCRYCNNSKRAKWPTKDRNIDNNGIEGFVSPYSKEYDLLFIRDAEGKIIPQSDLAKWIHKNLHLGLKRHSLIWQLEKIDATLDVLEVKYPKIKNTQTKDKITNLLFQFRQKVKDLQKDND
ncbi:HNH endonuclease signature motif containing protein [uncultured Winogradskyella sp.]|uniref:HNH endonuclease n=1 Tax=uncultured Winogradskyella sp. TaxID=395353 RepID=UPI0026082B5F|nr:HNH endonuclease signature motif containing protein [uncultured Winogradskyella sp.]